MKKIKILNGFLITLILLFIFHFYTMLFVMPKIIDGILEKTFFGVPQFYINFSFSVILFFGLIYIQRGLYHIIKNGFFNIKSSNLFNKGGVLLITSGICSFCFFLFTKDFNEENLAVAVLTKVFFTLLIGFSLFIISDFIKKGGVFKQENDLTI